MPNYLYGIIGILVLLAIIAAIVAIRRSSKIDHLPPEHRAKENELYEGFGLEKPHEDIPEDHSEKQKEVEEAFGEGMNVDVEEEKVQEEGQAKPDDETLKQG